LLLEGICGLGFDGNKKVLVRASEEPVYAALVLRRFAADEAIVATVEAFYIEFLARLNLVQLPEFGRQDDLALRGYGGLHKSKIAPYFCRVKHGRGSQWGIGQIEWSGLGQFKLTVS
jgi:hypothetical protein